MIQFPLSIKAWGHDDFGKTLKAELASLTPVDLQLQEGMRIGSHITDEPLAFMIIHKTETDNRFEIKLGVFFKTVIGGCSCADDPTPLDTNNEYCERLLCIDRHTAEGQIKY